MSIRLCGVEHRNLQCLRTHRGAPYGFAHEQGVPLEVPRTSACHSPYLTPHVRPLAVQDTIRTHLPLLLDDPPLNDDGNSEGDDDENDCTFPASGVARMAAGPDGGASTSSAASSSSSPLASPPPGPWSPARQDVPVHWVEAVAALLPHTDLLPYQVTSTQHLR